MEIDPTKLVLTIIDQGTPFDPRTRMQPDIKKLIAMKRDGGLGISLIKHTMDEIDYRQGENGQNELILTKYLKTTEQILQDCLSCQIHHRQEILTGQMPALKAVTSS